MSFKVVCYFDTRNIGSDLKRKFLYILQKNDHIYLKQSIKYGYNISICGIKDSEKAVKIRTELSEYIDNKKYSYNLDDFNEKYSKLNDPNYFEATSSNKVVIEKERLEDYFENIEQLELFNIMQRDLDLLLCQDYFIKNSIYKTTRLVDVMMKALNDKNSSNSHVSHFWYFFQSLSKNQKIEVYDRFKKNKTKYTTDDTKISQYLSEEINILIQQYIDEVKILIKNEKINFYSPYSFKKLKESNNFASELHKTTIFNASFQKEILIDEARIVNRWILNIFYEKLVLLKTSLLEKFFMNYLIGSLDQNIHLDASIEYYLETGEEKIW